MNVDLEPLLRPVAPDAPAGPDLSYDAERLNIEQAFAGDPGQEDWPRTIEQIATQAAATRDLWLAVYWARAGAKSGDLDAVATGLELLAGLFERFWDTVHPTLEDYGLEGRKGAVESLVRIGEFVAPLRQVPLLSHPRLGRFTGANIERFASEGAGADGYGPFRAAVSDSPPELFVDLQARLDRIEQAVRRADAVLSDQAQAAGQTGTNFQPTYDAIAAIARAVRQFGGPSAASAPATEREDVAAVGDAAASSAAPAADGLGRVASRGDVTRALDAVIDYYVRAEPSSPVPIALERIKEWIEMDFVAILADIAPGSLVEATTVLRRRRDEGQESEMM